MSQPVHQGRVRSHQSFTIIYTGIHTWGQLSVNNLCFIVVIETFKVFIKTNQTLPTQYKVPQILQ